MTRLFLLCVFFMQSRVTYSMNNRTLNKYTKINLPSALKPLRKKVITLLGCLDRFSREKFTIPKEIKVQIISYDHSLIYSPQLLKEVLPFLTLTTVSKYCESLPYGVMQDYLTLYGSRDAIQDTIQREIDKRDYSHSTSTWQYRMKIIMQKEIDYRDNYYPDEIGYPYKKQENISTEEIPVIIKSKKKHFCCQS